MHFLLAATFFFFIASLIPVQAEEGTLPISLKEADCVLYIDGLQMAGSEPAGLSMLEDLTDAYKTSDIKGTITAVIDDNAIPIILNSAAYGAETGTEESNPYAEQVAKMIKHGVIFAVCGHDLGEKSLAAEALLPGVKVTPRGILLVIELIKGGAVSIPAPSPGSDAKN